MFLQCLAIVGVLTICSDRVESAKILAVFPTPSISHQVVYQTLIKALAGKGHHITFVTTDPIEPNYPNVTQINLHEISYRLTVNKLNQINTTMSSNSDITTRLPDFYMRMLSIMDTQFNTPEMRELISNPERHKFDLFIGEHMFPTLFAFAELYKVPCIGINTFIGLQQQFRNIGNPSHPIFYSHAVTENIGPFKSIWEKLKSLYSALKIDFIIHQVLYPKFDHLTKKYFGFETLTAIDLIKKADLLYLNMNPLMSGVRPSLPTLISSERMHFEKDHSLPKDLQHYLDSSKKGVIYMSIGRTIHWKTLPEDRRQVFVETFRNLPYDILWKWEDENLADRPDNVRISKWLPQNDVLRHPNVKLFIAQSSIKSTEDAIKHMVPMIGIPFVWNEFFNSRRLEYFGIGIQLHINLLTKEHLRAAILHIMEDKQYAKNMAKLSEVMHDQPMRSMERAVWWTEYVLRHQGAPHLRSPLLNVSFDEYYMLDVLACMLTVLVVAIISIKYLLKLSTIIVVSLLR